MTPIIDLSLNQELSLLQPVESHALKLMKHHLVLMITDSIPIKDSKINPVQQLVRLKKDLVQEKLLHPDHKNMNLENSISKGDLLYQSLPLKKEKEL